MKRSSEDTKQEISNKKPKLIGSSSTSEEREFVYDPSSKENGEESQKEVLETSVSESNTEIIESHEAIPTIKDDSMKTKEALLTKLIGNYMENLRGGVEDQSTWDYLIASILEIYYKEFNYIDVLDQIEKKVEGIQGNIKTFESLCGLMTSIAGHSRGILEIFSREDSQYNEEWREMVTGKVYDSIYDIYSLG